MLIVNFSHPLVPAQLGRIEEISGQKIERVIEVNTQFDNGSSFGDQARALVDSVALSPEQWQAEALLINLPGWHIVAALLIAEMHGRIGYFPAVLRLRPVSDSVSPQFEVAEIINLQAVRDEARTRR
jgi:hypothetical protein